MKNKVKYLIFALLIAGMISSSANALNRYDFAGSADSSWTYVTNPHDYFLKDNSGGSAAVGWTDSDKDSHKMWFRLINSNKESRGSICLKYLTSGSFRTTAAANHFYWLQAKREYIIDPDTYVTGNWVI